MRSGTRRTTERKVVKREKNRVRGNQVKEKRGNKTEGGGEKGRKRIVNRRGRREKNRRGSCGYAEGREERREACHLRVFGHDLKLYNAGLGEGEGGIERWFNPNPIDILQTVAIRVKGIRGCWN